MRAARALFLVSLASCSQPGLQLPVGDCPSGRECQRVQVTTVEDVDLLFMIDNSNSMAEEQVNLIEELPRLVQVLASGDRNADGARDFNPVRSLHVGVITSDMGAGPSSGVPTCDPGLGDDGILLSRSRSLTPPCMASYPSGVFEFDRTDDPAPFAAEVGCVANIGTGGCGFEQQLEASLKALTPTSAQPWTRAGYAPPRFVSVDGLPDSVGGNAEGPNTGFLRPSSALAVVLVTDEEDCSVRDYGLFVSGDPRFTDVPLNLRCNTFGDPTMDIVHPVQRYVDGFLGLRRDPNHLIFSGIIGIPPETEPAPGAWAPEFWAILTNPNMIPRPNAMGTNLEPSCSTVNGVAYPPVRIVETAEGLSAAGAAVTLSSICSNDFGPAIDGIIAKIADALRGACLPHALNPNADGRVDCDLYELLPEAGPPGVISDCTRLAGRTFEGTVAIDGMGPRQLCLVNQVARADIATQAGWYYDDATLTPSIVDSCGETPQRITLTGLAPPPAGSEHQLACQ